MRSLLTRLAALSVVAVAVAGCAGSSGTALPIAGPPNSSQVGAGNSQTVIGTPGGTGGVFVPANTIAPKVIDNGTVSKTNTYAGFNVNAADTQSAVNATPDAQPSPPALPIPTEPTDPTDVGSHSVVVTGINATQAIITNSGTANLTYSFGGQQFDYSTLVAHLAFTAGTAPSSVSVEFTGGSGQTGFDVRSACTPATTPIAIGAAFVKYTCPIPAYAPFPIANTTGPNAINPGALGYFTPGAAKLSFVFNYATVPPAATNSTTVGIDYVYAQQ